MAAFQDTREQTEKKVMVHLLSEIDRNPSFTQRGLASELGIALGLMNQYLKGCVTKGWLHASQISPRRITYFLTPEGFKEKSNMVTDVLNPQESYDAIKSKVDPQKLIALGLLHISKGPVKDKEAL